MAAADKFAAIMREYAKAVRENAAEGVRITALAVDQTVVTATPIDTGQARLNWLVGVNRIPTEVKDAPESPAEGTNRALSRARRMLKKLKPGASVAISNGVHYIHELNNGKSRQAPANFVEKAVQTGKQAAKAVRLLRRKHL